MDPGLVAAGLGVGFLVGLTGMGAGSLMTPILITMFGIPAGTAVGTDLVYAAITKAFGAARHHQLKNVNKELALWMATGSVPAAFLGTFMLYNVFGNINAWLPDVIGFTLVLVGIAVAIRTFVTIRGLWDASKLPTDGPLTTRHKTYAVIIGVVFGFILGLTSVGSGVFFGMTLVDALPALGPAGGRHRPAPRVPRDDGSRPRHHPLRRPELRATWPRSWSARSRAS